ncbi:MAG: RAD55 family ATPase [Methanosarcinales archaeon]
MAITLYKNTDILNIKGEKEMPGLDDVLNNHDNIIYDTDVDGLLNPGFKQLEEVIESDDDIVLEQEPETKTFIEPKVAQPHLSPELLSSGIFVLDKNIGGGLPAGSVIYLSAATKSMSEIFLYQFTQSRKTYYFCTERRPKFVQQDIQNLNFDVSNITFIDVYGSYYLSPHGEMIDNTGNEYVDAKIVEFMEYNINNILSKETGNEINIIIDSFSFFLNLNVNHGVIRRLLNIIYETTKETGGLSFLYGMKGSHEHLIENEIFNICDAIFDVDIEKTADKIINKLSIPKLRGMIPNLEMIKFKIGDGIQIDTTKDIA